MIYCKSINPHNILNLTYSVASTLDMKNRYRKVFGDEISDIVEFRTINSFCVTVINEYGKVNNTKAFDLIKEQIKNNVIAKIYSSVSKEFANEGVVRRVATQITYCKNMMLSDEEIKEIDIDGVNFFKIYSEYEKYKQDNNLMDFDDQLKYAYTILKKYPEILNRFRARYKYINVDEAQDTSKIQHEIIRLLVTSNIFMVGDEDQSIYRF